MTTSHTASATDEIVVRTVRADELLEWGKAVSTGFLHVATDEEVAVRTEGLDPDRCRAAFAGSRIVATFDSFASDLTVPGGASLSASAITAVTTTATHRRRGILTRLMGAELSDSVDRGDALAVLIAAEWPIYGRFGFGAASDWQTLTLDAKAAQLSRSPRQVRIDLVGGDEVRRVVPALHETVRAHLPGDIRRRERSWDYLSGLVSWPGSETGPKSFHALARDDAGEVVGYLRYAVEGRWPQGVPRSEVRVSQLLAADPATELALWDYLLSLDLVGTIVAEDRGPGDILPLSLVDGRAARASELTDGIWVRVLDPVRALSTRRYLAPGRVVLELTDRQRHAAGTFALDGGPDGASCSATTESPELTLDVSVLGAAYLGGTSLIRLRAAGLVDEHRVGAVSRADAMFRSDVTPWCTTGF